MDDISFLPTSGSLYRGGIWERRDDEIENPSDPAARGDVEAVEREMQRVAEGDKPDMTESAENGESSNSINKSESESELKSLLSPVKETCLPLVSSDQNLSSRVRRSQSFTSEETKGRHVSL